MTTSVISVNSTDVFITGLPCLEDAEYTLIERIYIYIYILDGLACHVLEGSSSQFWKTVDKLKSSKTSQATSINGLSNETDIAQLWRRHFSEIYDMSGTSQNSQSQSL